MKTKILTLVFFLITLFLISCSSTTKQLPNKKILLTTIPLNRNQDDFISVEELRETIAKLKEVVTEIAKIQPSITKKIEADILDQETALNSKPESLSIQKLLQIKSEIDSAIQTINNQVAQEEVQADKKLKSKFYYGILVTLFILVLLAFLLILFRSKMKKKKIHLSLNKEKPQNQVHKSSLLINPQMLITPTHSIPTKHDLSNLIPSEITLLSVFAVLPSENIPHKIIEILVEPMEDLDSILLSLSQKGWIVNNLNTKSYICSSDLQEYVKGNNENLFEDCRNLINALMELLEYDTHTGHPINISLKEAVMFAHFGESVVKALEPKNRTVRFLCDRLGNYFKITGDLTKALKYFTEFNQLAKELYETNPGNVKYKNNLAISYQKLGDIFASKKDLEKSITCFTHFNLLAKELYKEYPENVKYKSNLAISCEKLGDIYTAKGNQEKALMFYFQHNQLTKHP